MTRSILVVDDNPDVREIVRIRLVRAGFAVIAAADGLTGLVAVHYRSPAAVLLGLRAPTMARFDFLAAVRRWYHRPPPVFVVNHSDDPELHERAQRLGARALFSENEVLQREFPDHLSGLLPPVVRPAPFILDGYWAIDAIARSADRGMIPAF